MTKIVLDNVANLQNENTVVTTLANNNVKLTTAIENTLSRDGTAPNQMNADFDMNSNRILNLVDAVNEQEPATYGQLIDHVTAVGSGAVIDAQYVTIATNPTLINERVLTAGNHLTLTDGGAGSTVTLDVNETTLNADTATLTNKTIDLTSNTLTGTTAQFNTALSDNDFATLAGSETLTNKTLTSPTLTTPNLGAATATSLNVTGLTASQAVHTDGSKNLVSVANTGTGNNVLATSPTLVTPALGTPSSATLTNATDLPISTGVSGLGTGVATFLATPSSANLRSALTDEVGTGAAYFVGGALGTPASGTLTNATDLPISTGVSGLGTGVATFLATPSSANLASALTDETGTGANVFATSPTLVTPNLGTPSAVTLTNATGLPLSGLTNQAAYTFVGNNSGSSAAPTAVDMATLTTKATPAAGDYVMLSDQAASGAWKKATIASVGSSSGVSSLNSLTGALTWSTNIQVFTASGTYTPTSGMKYCIIECLGGGGGGGGSAGNASYILIAGGGGAGAYSRKIASAATIGASQTVTVGAAGAAGGSGDSNGGTGGDSSVGTICVAKGGLGGTGASVAHASSGGAGGAFSLGTGDVKGQGATGVSGFYQQFGSTTNILNSVAGIGAHSFLGSGGLPGSTNANGSAAPGNVGVGYGSGGGAGAANQIASNVVGAAGTAGIVIITEYILA